MWIEPLKEDLLVLEEKIVKNTARCPLQYILMNTRMEKYLLVAGRTSVQKFYIKRSIAYQRKWYECFSKYNFHLNLPVAFWEENYDLKVLYHFFDNPAYVKNGKPLKYINKIYKNDIKIIESTKENVNLMLDCFLDAWPLEYHQRIRELSLFEKYENRIKKHKYLKVCLEHGDFTVNNIVMTNTGDIYLMDFEFTKENQPIGMDKLDFKRTRTGKYRITEYYQINSAKYDLMEEINNIIDNIDHPKTEIMNR